MDYPVSDPGSNLYEGKFTDGNPSLGIPPSIDKAAHMNAVYDELLSIIIGFGGTPDEEVFDQAFTVLAAALNTRAPLASPALTGNPTAPTQAPGNNSTRLANTAFVQAAVQQIITAISPPGKFGFFATPSAPAGWLKCNGAAVSRTTYAPLFAEIGTLWGEGNGTTTFNLPDVRGEFFRGFDDGRGIDTGRLFASLQLSEMLAHYHLMFNGDSVNGGLNANNHPAVQNGNGAWNGYTMSGTGNLPYLGRTSSVGGGETRPRNIPMLVCIRY